MPEPSEVEQRIAEIRSCFSAVIGAGIVWYETAELLDDHGTWSSCPDYPIRLFTDSGKVIAISWSQFDDLWIRTDLSLPFVFEGLENASIRWVRNSVANINAIVGMTIRSVLLGRGQMSVEGHEVEIWTRLLIQLDNQWLEIRNVLDENGYELHLYQPPGTFIPCI